MLRPLLHKLIRFGIIGLGASLLYAVLTYLFITMGWLNAIPASITAYCLAIPVSFIGQKHFTFKAHGQINREMRRFILTQSLGIGIAAGVMALAEMAPFDPRLGILTVIILVPLMSFILMNSFVFTKSNAS